MDNQRWEKVKQVFAQVVERPEALRAAALDDLCAGDEELKGEVRSLLEARTLGAGHSVRTGGARQVVRPSESGDERSTAVSSVTERVGETIGPYKLLQLIGEGGFGLVFMAEQDKPVRRRVALKVIRLGMDTKAVIARFEAERQALAMMEHPNIAKVFDAGTTPTGRPYFVMELVKGEPITAYCDRNTLSVRDRLELFEQVCRAVQHAHTKGVMHRDIKPSNVLVGTQDGRPLAKVIDFGIAKATEHRLTDRTLATDLHALIGTPEYMSPEQAEGSLDIDTRTDVYALGVLLYELLTGTTPFDARTLRAAGYEAMLRMIREVEPPTPSVRLSRLTEPRREVARGTRVRGAPERVVAEEDAPERAIESASAEVIASQRRTEPKKLGVLVRGELDWIVMKSMDKDRSRRYETANALAADVERYLAGEPVVAAPPSALYRVRKFVRRHRPLVGATAGVALALLMGIGGTSWGFVTAAKRAEGERQAKLEAQQGRELAEAKTAEAQAALAAEALASEAVKLQSYVGNIQMAQAAFEAKLYRRVRQRLDACPERLRGWEWRWLDARADQSCVVVDNAYFQRHRSIASADGTRLVTLAFERVPRVCNALTGETTHVLKGHTAAVTCVGLDRSGELVATASLDGTARIWSAVSGECLHVLNGHSSYVQFAEFSADGSRLATASSDKTARIWDVKTGDCTSVLAGHSDTVESVEFDAAGKRLLTVSNDRTARLWDTASGTQLGVFPIDDESPTAAALNPSGTLVVTARDDGSLGVWDAKSGSPLLFLRGHSASISDVEFSRDGAWIATASGDGTARVWNAETGECVATLGGHDGWVHTARFSPDATRLITASDDKTARVWEIPTGASKAVLLGHTFGVASAWFAADGQKIITTSYDGTIRIWDADSRMPATRLEWGRCSPGAASFSPDGARLVTCSEPNCARVWDVAAGAPLREFIGHDRTVRSAAFSPAGDRIVTASDDHTACVWDSVTGDRVVTLAGHTDGVNSALFDRSGARVITASSDETVRIWDARTGECLSRLDCDRGGGVVSAEFNSDGSRVLTRNLDYTASLWDASTRAVLTDLESSDGSVMSAEFSSDGRRVVTARKDAAADVWDAGSGARLFKLEGHAGGLVSARFSRDGRRIVTTSVDNTARVWDASTRRVVAVLREHEATVNSAQFSPDGGRVVTSGDDQVVRLFDSETGELLVEPATQTGPLDYVGFSPDGTRLVASGWYFVGQMWDSARYAVRRREIHEANGVAGRASQVFAARRAWGQGLTDAWEAFREDAISDALERSRWLAAAEDVWRKASDGAADTNSEAWALCESETCRDADAAEAVGLAMEATAEDPSEPDYHSTLGVAWFRLGFYHEAVAELLESERLYDSDIPDPLNWSMISMAQHRLGQPDLARTSLLCAEEGLQCCASDPLYSDYAAFAQPYVKLAKARINSGDGNP